MSQKPGMLAPHSGIYCRSVCKTPVKFKQGEELPTCNNLCGRGNWELVKALEAVK